MEFRRAFDPVRALGVAWNLMMRAPLTLLVGGILIWLTSDGGIRFNVELDAKSFEDPRFLVAGGVLGAAFCCVAFALFLFNCLLQVGFAGAVQRVMVTGEERFADLFKERGLWLAMILARVLRLFLSGFSFLPVVFLAGGPILIGVAVDLRPVGIAAGVLFALCYMPIWIYVLLGLVLVEQAVAVESKNPVEALQRSWELASGNRLHLLLFTIVTGVVSIAGLLLCCVGVLLTSAWSYVAWYESYIRLTLPAPEEGMWVDRSSA